VLDKKMPRLALPDRGFAELETLRDSVEIQNHALAVMRNREVIAMKERGVIRRDYADLMPQLGQGLGQRSGHIRQAAGFGKRHDL
jgi:hypothetical protein